mgnify:CR=1 FL=1
MRREVTLEEISDGRLYDANDMVKADCQDCKGCHDCCTGMGDSVLLDPYDVCRLSRGLRKIPEELIGSVLELGISDGNVLPHLAMCGTEEKCVFLNKEGRCSIHEIRPGFCFHWEDIIRKMDLNISFRSMNVQRKTVPRSR